MGNSAIKEKIERAESTKILSLDGCKVKWKEVDSALKKVTTLRSLDLSNNGLKGDIDGVARHTELKKLYLGNNKLQRLSLDKLSVLEELTATNNVIQNIDLTGNLRLKKLLLSKNLLTTVMVSPECQLKEIDLSNNKLKSIPTQIMQLPSLTSLNVSHNSIAGIDTSVPIKCKSLQQLILTSNKITTLPRELFTDTKLHTLDIDDNVIQPEDLKQLDGYESWLQRQKGTVDKQISGGLTAKLIENK
eukprot:TRINITY_DN25148_c0_g1_i1.p1 TRINITY_DN25148_c0_g1~~TRINITY_DN25148_c0_g1_i1.p1  ORF type:complete len:246 (+),score=50.60 TRINITY_DN25148_c0_g1_i1:39-776(+)